MIRLIIALMFAGSVYADNEIYIDQSGDNVNIDLEQLGSSNIIGGLNSTNGSMTAAVLTGGTCSSTTQLSLATVPPLGYQI